MNLLLNWKTYLKFLSRNKGYTAIDLFGLSVSLMFVLVIAVYVWQELSTDQFQEKKERIYVVGNEEGPYLGAAIPYMIKERYPEIEKVCPMVLMVERLSIDFQTSMSLLKILSAVWSFELNSKESSWEKRSLASFGGILLTLSG